MVFGDSRQAIYGFAGATYTPLSDVLAGVEGLTLPNSWRLTQQNADLASAVAGLPRAQTIRADRQGKLPVVRLEASVYDLTAQLVADVQALIAAGARFHEIAVLARTRAVLYPFEAALLAANIRTDRHGIDRSLRHVRRVLRLSRLVEKARENAVAVSDGALKRAFPTLTAASARVWKREAAALDRMRRPTSFDGLFQRCGRVYLRLQGGINSDKERRNEVNRWVPRSRAFERSSEMLAAIREMGSDRVQSGTIHSANGREWKQVLVVGVTDGFLPYRISHDDKRLEVEGRNLLYVAITRAIDTVHLYHAPWADTRRRTALVELSPFLQRKAATRAFVL